MSTRVVSWNDAAEMNDSVESDALVMPSSSGRPVAGLAALRDDPLVLLAELELVHLLFQQERGVAHVLDLHPAHHLADDHLDVLVADVHALQAVDLLDFVHQVGLQLLLAEHGQDVVRVERAVHQRFAGADALAFLHVDVDAARHRVLLLGAVVGDHEDLALALAISPNLTTPSISLMTAVSRGLRASNSSTTRGRPPVMSLVLVVSRGILASTSPGEDLVAVLHHQVGARRHQVALAGLAALDHDGRLALLVRRVGDHLARQARDFVHFLVQRDAFLQVLEADRAADFGQDGEGVRIPLDQHLAQLHLLRLRPP